PRWAGGVQGAPPTGRGDGGRKAKDPPASPGWGPGPVYPADAAPPSGGHGYRSAAQSYEPGAGTNPHYGVPGAIPPGPAGSAKQDAIRREAMRSALPISPGQIGPRPNEPAVSGSTQGDPRNMVAFPADERETGSVQQPQNYEPASAGLRPYYGVPGTGPPRPAGSAKQDTIRQ